MAVNKNSTGFTITFAVVLVAVCGFILAFLSTSLKETQKSNVDNEKRQFILSAAGDFTSEQLKEMDKQQISDLFNERITQSVIDNNGQLIEGVVAFDIDVVKEYKSTKANIEARKYPLFVYTNGNEKKYIIPMAGNGLWGPVWAFAALGSDQNTISGIVFDHKGETPGLGAKITEPVFTDKFKSPKTIMEGDNYVSVSVVKGEIKDPKHQIDAIAGATITSKGVGEMLVAGFKPYMKHWGKIK